MPIPVYGFTGFLEAGKTKFIQETLEDPRFNAGERTLLLVCEEGEEEYDSTTYPHKCVYQEIVEDLDALTTEDLAAMVKKYHAQRVVVELNGMRMAGDFYNKMPQDWQIAQEVMFADSNTILSYNANMRQLVVDKLSGAEMVVFNRVPLGADIMPYHKLARAVNRRIDIVYDYVDGSTQFDEIEDPLPFDISASTIEIQDEDYALFYRDITEEPKKYDKKIVRPGTVCHDLLRGGYHLHGYPVQMGRQQQPEAEKLGHGHGPGVGPVPQPLSRRRPHPDRHGSGPCRTCRRGSRNILNAYQTARHGTDHGARFLSTDNEKPR